MSTNRIFQKKVPKNTPDSHTHAGITIHYDFAPTVIEVRRVRMYDLSFILFSFGFQ